MRTSPRKLGLVEATRLPANAALRESRVTSEAKRPEWEGELHSPRVSCPGTLGEGRRTAGGRRCKFTLTLARALRRPPLGVFLYQGSTKPLLLLRGCTREGLSIPWWSDRSLPKWAQLCKPRPNSQRLGKEPLPATVRFPSPHPQT